VTNRDALPQTIPDSSPRAASLTMASPPRIECAPNGGSELGTRGLSLRLNFAWILTGNLVYAICQWGSIVALAKLGSSFIVGQFSLGLAISTPVLMLTNLQLRAVQSTDSRRLYSFGEYLRLRSASTLVGLVAIVGIAWFGHYERQTAMVILIIALAKGVETLSDIHYGLFQLNDRLDQTGKSMMLRGVLLVAALSTGLYLARSVLWGCAALTLAWLGALLFFDVGHGRSFVPRYTRSSQHADHRRPWDLMRLALPLGIATTMATLNLNMPRYFIHIHMGERQLGIYSALAYTTVAMILVSDSLGHCAIPRLSRLYNRQMLAEFRSLLFRLLAAAGLLGLAGLVAVQLIGAHLLTFVYGSEYAAQFRTFLVLVLAAAVYCVACMFTIAITSARCFRIQVPLYVLVVGSNALACAHWVPTAGLAGGAAAMLVAATVQLVFGAAIVSFLLRMRVKHPARLQTEAWGNSWEASL
jgi:O-antigen/teichoic acid export membrane protein